MQGVIRKDGYKLLVGKLPNSFWQGPTYPNSSGYPSQSLDCGTGCLFNVFNDQNECNDIAGANPEIVEELRALILEHSKGVLSPKRGGDDGLACAVSLAKWGGTFGPFLDG